MTALTRALLILLVCVPAQAANWPSWRGLDGSGHSPESGLPLKWDAKENVRWKVPLPAGGNSSPIVWRDRIFLTQALDKGARRAVLCVDRADGKLLWQRDTPFQGKESTHEDNPYCAATPVTDGERVIASLGSAGLVCYDFAGNELWRKDLGKLEHIWGNASSPILYGDLAILWCGPGERQFLLAVHKSNGEKVWETPEPGGKSGAEGAQTWRGSWTTPVIAKIGDHDELILGVPEKLKGYDPKTGKELWFCSGLGPLVYTSPVVSKDGIVVAMSGYHGAAMAVRAGGRGDVTKTHRLWHHTQKIPQRIGSPVLVGQHVYMLNENGLAQCFDLHSGQDLWQKERASTSPSWGSLVSAGGRLYVTNHAGETLVFAAGPRFELLAKNPLGERVLASIAVSDSDLFIRSYKHLWCIRGKNGRSE
jgi:outer membrane protein assembly factor BamB